MKDPKIVVDRGATAMVRLRAMRYKLKEIQEKLAENGTETSVATLWRIEGDNDYKTPKGVGAALVQLHNSLCKRGERV